MTNALEQNATAQQKTHLTAHEFDGHFTVEKLEELLRAHDGVRELSAAAEHHLRKHKVLLDS